MQRAAIILGLVMTTWCQATPVACAQAAADKVMIKRKGSRKAVTYTGRVEDYAAGNLRLRLLRNNGTQVRSFDSSEVVAIETGQSEAHSKGTQLFKAGQYKQAIIALEDAEEKETRDWVRRDILMLQTQAHLKWGNRLAAARAFVRLTDSDPNTHHHAIIPLWWTEEAPNPAAQRAARQWLTGANRSARLIAASILMSNPDTRPEAMATLKNLVTNGRIQHMNFAQVQRWRERLALKPPIADEEIDYWRRRMDAMKPEERAGAWFLIGRARERQQKHEAAALAYLWIPLIYKDDHWFAAEACFSAAQQLEKSGRLREAEAMYRETFTRFSDTPFATKAKLRLTPDIKPQQGSQPPDR